MKKAIVAAVIGLIALAGLASIAMFQLDKMAQAQKQRDAAVQFAGQIEREVTGLLSRFTKATESQATALSPKPFLQISADAKASVERLKSTKPPGGGKSLRDDAVELATLIGETSSNMAATITYAALVESATETLKSNISSSPESLAAFAKDVRVAQKQVKKVIIQLKKADPPKSYEEFHSKLIGILGDFAVAAGEVAGAAELNKYESVLRSIEDIDKVTKRFDALEAPSKSSVVNDVFSDAEREQLRTLAGRIDAEITQSTAKAK